MKNLSYTLSCIQKDVYTVLFYFLRLSCSHSSHSSSSLFGSQQQFIHPSVKSSTLPFRKIPVFQGVAPRHTIFTSSCVISLQGTATAHSPSGKDLNPSSQEDACFSGRCTSAYTFLLHPASSLFGTQQQLTHPPVKSSTLSFKKIPVFQGVAPRHTLFTSSCVIPLWDSATVQSPSGKGLISFLSGRIMFLRAYCFVNVLTLSCLGSLWFGSHPYYSLKPYMHLQYPWSISIAKDRRYPKYFILCVVYFYSERSSLLKIFYSMCSLFLQRKTAAQQSSVARDIDGVSQIRLHLFFLTKQKTILWFTTTKPLIRRLLL